MALIDELKNDTSEYSIPNSLNLAVKYMQCDNFLEHQHICNNDISLPCTLRFDKLREKYDIN